MKTTLQNRLSTILVTMVAGSFLMAGSIKAQVHTRGSGKGGATKLMQFHANKQLNTAIGEPARAMSCEKCRDVLVTVRESHFKGGNTMPSVLPQGARRVMRHTCPDCQTHWKITGHGKQKTRTPVHMCAKCL